MHESIVHQFAKLAANKILFSTCVSMINEMHSANYYKKSLSYYDAAFDASRMSTFEPTLLDPFLKFFSPGECNGIKLSRKSMRKIFINFMIVHEP